MDEQCDKLIEHHQHVLFDDLPLYCTYCKHQGHEDADCRLMIQKYKIFLKDNASNVNMFNSHDLDQLFQSPKLLGQII